MWWNVPRWKITLSCKCKFNVIMSRLSLKSTEVKDCFRIVGARLISFFWTSSCCQTSFPTIIRPMLYLWRKTSKMKLNIPELNSSIFLSPYCLIVKKTDYLLRDFVRFDRLFWWINVNPFSFMHRFDNWCINKFSLFCGFAFAFDLDALTVTLVCDVSSWSGSARTSVLLWLESITYLCACAAGRAELSPQYVIFRKRQMMRLLVETEFPTDNYQYHNPPSP